MAHAATAADAPIWTFGVVGTAGNFSGADLPVTEAPLPDGTYTVAGLLLLPL